MPDPKTIEIDEIVTADQSADDGIRQRKGPAPEAEMPDFGSENPFSDLEGSLPWKARWTLRLTRWFMLLRSKPWGKWVIVPGIILGVILAIPLGLLLFCFLIIRSFLRPSSR